MNGALRLNSKVSFALGPVVDTWSGVVAQAIVPEPAGELSIWFYHPATGSYQETPPYNVEFGDTIGFYAFGENTSGRFQHMRVVVRLYDPDGLLVNSGERDMDVAAGGIFSSPTLEATVAKTGAYTGEAELYAE